MDLYFSQRFDVEPELLVEHGAFNISVASDLPLFVDPFLLFNSEKDDYQELHREILRYLGFLRDKALPDLEEGLIDDWYRFKEGDRIGWASLSLAMKARVSGPSSPSRCTKRSATSSPVSARRRSPRALTWRSSA